MQRYIDADKVNAALDRIREEAWLHDIPSPTVPEYIEHHDAIQQIMLVIDKERKLLNDAADVAQVRHGRWSNGKRSNVYGDREIICSECGEGFLISPKVLRYCPNCGTLMDGSS